MSETAQNIDNRPSILIVDDRPEKLLSLAAVLEDLPIRIVRAESGRAALRHVLNEDFALILMDVNMPGMDGFETAGLIRQRNNSRDVPIIFLTAFGDDIYISRSYSLGAVDYIQAPVVPEVLRTKVQVFVELYLKTAQVKQQAEVLRLRAEQSQKLAAAAMAINASLSTTQMLQTITDAARDIISSHMAITLFLRDRGPGRARKVEAVGSFSERYSFWAQRELEADALVDLIANREPATARLNNGELEQHVDGGILRGLKLPTPQFGVLAAPLRGHDGAALGVVYVCDRAADHYTAADEAILVQLTQMASIAIENTIYSQEREANRLKDEFLATLSHELRTPLNAILGWTHLLRMENSQGEVAHGLDVIERNAKAQTKLIEDLLDVSRITTGKMRLNMRKISMLDVVQAALDAIRPAAEAKSITLELHRDAEIGQISGDADRLQQVIWNLLSNAVKFTPSNGNIAVSVTQSVENVVVRVTDSGHGIAHDFLPHVFERFRQADSTSTRAHGGLGIGLAIVRHIVELHGGSVRADSPGEGQGASFIVNLPIAVAKPVDALPTTTIADTPDQPNEDLEGVRVLVVDDEQDAREVITEVLKRRNATVKSVATVEEAMQELSVFRPSVLVSDIAMPDADGYELIRRVRSLPAEDGGMIPAIALTAYARPNDRAHALSCGFQAHVAKPVTPHELVTQICSLNLTPDPAAASTNL